MSVLGDPAQAPARTASFTNAARSRMGGDTWRVSTPFLLRVGMVLAVIPVAAFALAAQVGVSRNDDAVETVGQDATQGITVAQQIKLNLAELDGIVAADLLDPQPLGSSGYPDDYNIKRRELQENLALAAGEVSTGVAFQQPLVNIGYGLGHYHALLRESFAAAAGGDSVLAATSYSEANEVMEGTLLSEADGFDKANTYLLNTTYDRHQADATSATAVIVASWLALLVLLGVVQFLVARKFRRLVNLALVGATLIAAATGSFVITRLDDSSSHLTEAREHAFDSVHVLARAQATAVSARQAQVELLLDPSDPAASEEAFSAQADKLFRLHVSDDVAETAQAGHVPEGAGGYLATVIKAGGSEEADDAAREALRAFGDFLAADDRMRDDVVSEDSAATLNDRETSTAFTDLTSAIDEAQAIEQRAFDTQAGAATDATTNLGILNAVAATAVLALVLAGLYLRLREYRS